MTQEELFAKYQPTLDDMEIMQINQANGPAVSAVTRPSGRGGLVVKFATAGGGSYPAIVMNRLTAEYLFRQLQQHGF
jgi:hypothetical protein